MVATPPVCERVVCVFDSAEGPFVLVLVGVTIVGSMATVWHGTVNPPRRPDVTKWRYAAGEVSLKKGEEMGCFLLGSTVVMLFPEDRFHCNLALHPAGTIRMGEAMSEGRIDDGAPVAHARARRGITMRDPASAVG